MLLLHQGQVFLTASVGLGQEKQVAVVLRSNYLHFLALQVGKYVYKIAVVTPNTFFIFFLHFSLGG